MAPLEYTLTMTRPPGSSTNPVDCRYHGSGLTKAPVLAATATARALWLTGNCRPCLAIRFWVAASSSADSATSTRRCWQTATCGQDAPTRDSPPTGTYCYGRRHRGLFWSYQTPFREVTAVKGYLAPYNERVDLIIDGHPQQRPAGPLSPRAEPSTPAA
jgi:hypothetical protein